jgi:hypothetical protein
MSMMTYDTDNGLHGLNEKQDFLEALMEMKCPFCGCGIDEGGFTFEPFVEMEIGRDAYYHQAKIRNYYDLPEPHLNKWSFCGMDTMLTCKACTCASPVRYWFLLEESLFEVKWFTLEFKKYVDNHFPYDAEEPKHGSIMMRILGIVGQWKHKNPPHSYPTLEPEAPWPELKISPWPPAPGGFE